MKQMALRVVILLLLLAPFCGAQEKEAIDRIFSLDIVSYALTGMLNKGWGMGLSYERKIVDRFSIKGTFGHMTFLTGMSDVYCASVHVAAFLNYYPLSGGFDKLYVSLGNGCDFMQYFGDGDLPEPAKDTLISLTPKLGWKLFAARWLMFDVSAGYKFIIVDSGNYRNIRDYANIGFQFGFGFKLFLNRAGKDGEDV
jgi:hypothetical protein